MTFTLTISIADVMAEMLYASPRTSDEVMRDVIYEVVQGVHACAQRFPQGPDRAKWEQLAERIEALAAQ